MNPSIIDISPVLSQIAINETRLMFGKVAKRQIGGGNVWPAHGQQTVSPVCLAKSPEAESHYSLGNILLLTSSMVETNLANCECDCRNILQLISWLTAAVVVLGLCSLMMLIITLYLFKKSRATPYHQNIELLPFGNEVSTNQHKINSFTCLELKEISRITFYLTSNLISNKNYLSTSAILLLDFDKQVQ